MRPRPSPVAAVLAGAALLALLQQQWLLRRPPRLEALANAPAASGPAALRARFSRPMDPARLRAASRLHPPLAHRWLGEGDTLLLALAPGQRLAGALHLVLAGVDRRGLPLAPGTWRWDPRPRVLAVVPVPGGEQLRVRGHDGRWQALGPVWHQITQVEPLGDGSAVGVVSREPSGNFRVWRLPLRQRDPAPAASRVAPLAAGAPRSLDPRELLFAHLSGNRRGDLLVQSGGLGPAEAQIRLWPAGGRRRRLDLAATGPLRLLPEGGAVVVPEQEGLALHDLPPRPPRRQTLPGSRDLSSFCPQAGRALLLRHWPDFRRSLERVEPGQPPRQLWIGPQALVASACERGGERVWAFLVEGVGRPELTLLALDRQGRVRSRRRFPGWELEPGTGLHHDPTTGRLLAALRPLGDTAAAPAPARPVLLDDTTLEPRPLEVAARQAVWLPPG